MVRMSKPRKIAAYLQFLPPALMLLAQSGKYPGVWGRSTQESGLTTAQDSPGSGFPLTAPARACMIIAQLFEHSHG